MSDRRTGEKRIPQALTWLEGVRQFHYQLFGVHEVLLTSALIISAVQIPRRSMHSPCYQRNFKSLQHRESGFNALFCGSRSFSSMATLAFISQARACNSGSAVYNTDLRRSSVSRRASAVLPVPNNTPHDPRWAEIRQRQCRKNLRVIAKSRTREKHSRAASYRP